MPSIETFAQFDSAYPTTNSINNKAKRMVLDKDEYRIEGDGIWISKAALEECRNHYCKVADKFKPKPKKQDLDFRWPFYVGKADVCIDLLKHFEPLEL